MDGGVKRRQEGGLLKDLFKSAAYDGRADRATCRDDLDPSGVRRAPRVPSGERPLGPDTARFPTPPGSRKTRQSGDRLRGTEVLAPPNEGGKLVWRELRLSAYPLKPPGEQITGGFKRVVAERAKKRANGITRTRERRRERGQHRAKLEPKRLRKKKWLL